MNISEQLATLPKTPGIYIYKDARGNILYVGKAKKLSARVRSYFRPVAELDAAKQQMVKLITTIETISCDNETEALVLEANLIRQHQPPYNVVLRDDKYYLFIKITTNEEYPRVFPVRRVKRDGARYFGPYSSSQSVRATLRLLRRLFPYKGEKDSPHDVIFPHPLFSPATGDAPGAPRPTHRSAAEERRVGVQAKAGPVAGKEQYLENIQNIIRFLSGQREEIMKTLRAGMEQASRAQHFERAAHWRDQLQSIERLEGTQKVFLTTKESFDVVSLARTATRGAANVFQVRGGKLLGKQTFLLQHRSEASPTDTLRQFILQYYSVAQDIPKKILIPENLHDQTALAQWINSQAPPLFTKPERGKKKQLLAMGEANAAQLLAQEEINFGSDTRLKKALERLFQAIGIEPASTAGPPCWRVETYDISNIQGTLPTASMVVFKDGKPKRSEYRKFRLLREQSPAEALAKEGGSPPKLDDYASIRQTLARRFSGRHPDWPLPHLIIIDGGKGQLSSAKKVLEELGITVPTVALAKREEEIFLYPEQSRRAPQQFKTIRLPYDSDALYLIQRMRDEAHRFTLAYHRRLRDKRSTRSILDDIPGIGPKTKKQLLQHFGSVKNIRTAGEAKIEKVVGKSKTAILQDYL